jgi:AcrR family transcriptional regulator
VGKAERRQQILNVARDVFAKRGYHAAKIEDIVLAASIARGTFYLYFEDKRAIFEEIVDRTIARLGMSIVRVDPHDGGRTVADQVKEQIRRIVRILLEDRATTKTPRSIASSSPSTTRCPACSRGACGTGRPSASCATGTCA